VGWKTRSGCSYWDVGYPLSPIPPSLSPPRTYRIAHALRHRTGGRLQATQGERLGGRGAGGEDGQAQDGQRSLVAEHALSKGGVEVCLEG